MREWGRIGSTGHPRSVPFPTPHEAKPLSTGSVRQSSPEYSGLL
ncbi:MAG: hypothetical protein JO217_07480 [Acidobacteriaceae bacterium]|nr:hypothetical protein [Acidobacteriaceae bacterium]MBV9442521.1 hypothetical protein [Acidobacteriaceae bacterium]